jgi:hypothetical protein
MLARGRLVARTEGLDEVADVAVADAERDFPPVDAPTYFTDPSPIPWRWCAKAWAP